MYLNFFLTSLVEIPGNAFAIYAMNRLVCQPTDNLLKLYNVFTPPGFYTSFKYHPHKVYTSIRRDG